MRKIVTLFLLFLSVFTVYGTADSVKVVFFALSKATFDPTLDNNASSMDDFIDSIVTASKSGTLDHIAVYGYASPDGPFALNNKLSLNRCNMVARYVSRQAGIPLNYIEIWPKGVAWDELRQLVMADASAPERHAVLQVLDEYLPDACTNQAKSNQCKERLIAIDGGRSYKWMVDNLFPRLRYAIALYTTTTPDGSIATQALEDFDFDSNISSTGDDNRDADRDINGEKDDDTPSEMPDDMAYQMVNEMTDATPPHCNSLSHSTLHKLAVKTNLLYDAALLPNIEVEWRFNSDWSVALEGGVAWWGRYSHNRSYRLALIDPEVRRWIRPRGPWHGLYVGIFAGGGIYDLQNSSRRGYRGEGAMGGVSAGYMWPISRCLSLEAEIGAGYLYTRYKEYQPLDGHHVYKRTKDLNYVGPLKVKFSLVWRLWDINKPRNNAPIPQ